MLAATILNAPLAASLAATILKAAQMYSLQNLSRVTEWVYGV